MLAMRKAMHESDVHIASKQICEALLSLSLVQNAMRIMAYCAHQNEPDIMDFMNDCLDDGKCIYLPSVAGEGRIVPVDFHRDCRMSENRYGIPEPEMTNTCDPLPPDIVIVPGIVFDTSLRRIGYGGGYYDRFLETSDAIKIGVCYDRQIVGAIRHDSHDVPMNMIVTETRVLHQRSRETR